jgi:hypothetical protein
MSEYITKKKKKINLDEIVSKAINKEDKPQYITKKKKIDLADLPSLQKKKRK